MGVRWEEGSRKEVVVDSGVNDGHHKLTCLNVLFSVSRTVWKGFRRYGLVGGGVSP